MKLFKIIENIKKLIIFFKNNKKKKSEEEKLKFIRSTLFSIHNNLVLKNKNMAIFVFDRLGVDISIKGIYDGDILNNLKNSILNKKYFKKSVCLDIGANIGNHTVFFSNIFKKVYAFEPHPDNFDLLNINTKKIKNIKIFNFALSNKNELMPIIREEEQEHTSCKLVKKKDLKKNKYIEKILVSLKKFDDIYKKILKNEKISFIKLDVEYHEEFVLEGMKKVLKKHSPIICFEQHPNQFFLKNNEYSSTTVNILKEEGYKYFYELESIKRNWKLIKYQEYFNNFFFKILESILYGIPKNIFTKRKIMNFEKKKYSAIVASKNKL